MATIKDVAKQAGLSVGTVSRVFNNRGYLSEDARSRVMEACKALDYYPSEVARSLYRKHTNVIGVIVPYVSHPFFSQLVQSIEESCSGAGYKIMLGTSNHEVAKEREYAEILRRGQVDGIIVCSRTEDLDYLSTGKPVLSVERILSDEIPAVLSDNAGGGRLAAETLLRRGCRHPLLVCSGKDGLEYVPATSRERYFCEYCREHGVEPHFCFIPASYMKDDLTEPLRKAFADYPETDGIFASGDVQAIRVMHICRDLLGRRIPEEVQLLGYDNIELAEYCGLSTIAQPINEMGVYAVRTLLSIIEGEIVPNRIMLPVRLAERETTRRPE